jgi:hypothetical protein
MEKYLPDSTIATRELLYLERKTKAAEMLRPVGP